MLQQDEESAAHSGKGQLAETNNSFQCLLSFGSQDMKDILPWT